MEADGRMGVWLTVDSQGLMERVMHIESTHVALCCTEKGEGEGEREFLGRREAGSKNK